MSLEIKLPIETIIVSETDAKGNIIFANEDFCKIAGYSIDELIGKPHNIVRHSDMPKIAFEGLWETIKAGRIWKGIVKNKTKSGGYYWVNATAYPSKTSNGELRYISIRIKPTEQEIIEASNLYETLK
ncbi:PAS domain-containing protein [Arcobacter cloacae]|uniref:PAS sensor domain-containing protein n=1 Tax=Arcobacter cloacae TaxID=1054034 RepID=A0A6M8NM96_9BACT|nr:PAS domain-containing protein [Arcobacter cloacae]QKF91121.1 PAS sensor-containing signal transduction protein [Arcobacter cloacae]RXI38909.1 PAS sensor domain-containing protein [Arcobacter cloacae]